MTGLRKRPGPPLVLLGIAVGLAAAYLIFGGSEADPAIVGATIRGMR